MMDSQQFQSLVEESTYNHGSFADLFTCGVCDMKMWADNIHEHLQSHVAVCNNYHYNHETRMIIPVFNTVSNNEESTGQKRKLQVANQEAKLKVRVKSPSKTSLYASPPLPDSHEYDRYPRMDTESYTNSTHQYDRLSVLLEQLQHGDQTPSYIASKPGLQPEHCLMNDNADKESRNITERNLKSTLKKLTASTKNKSGASSGKGCREGKLKEGDILTRIDIPYLCDGEELGTYHCVVVIESFTPKTKQKILQKVGKSGTFLKSKSTLVHPHPSSISDDNYTGSEDNTDDEFSDSNEGVEYTAYPLKSEELLRAVDSINKQVGSCGDLPTDIETADNREEMETTDAADNREEMETTNVNRKLTTRSIRSILLKSCKTCTWFDNDILLLLQSELKKAMRRSYPKDIWVNKYFETVVEIEDFDISKWICRDLDISVRKEDIGVDTTDLTPVETTDPSTKIEDCIKEGVDTTDLTPVETTDPSTKIEDCIKEGVDTTDLTPVETTDPSTEIEDCIKEGVDTTDLTPVETTDPSTEIEDCIKEELITNKKNDERILNERKETNITEMSETKPTQMNLTPKETLSNVKDTKPGQRSSYLSNFENSKSELVEANDHVTGVNFVNTSDTCDHTEEEHKSTPIADMGQHMEILPGAEKSDNKEDENADNNSIKQLITLDHNYAGKLDGTDNSQQPSVAPALNAAVNAPATFLCPNASTVFVPYFNLQQPLFSMQPQIVSPFQPIFPFLPLQETFPLLTQQNTLAFIAPQDFITSGVPHISQTSITPSKLQPTQVPYGTVPTSKNIPVLTTPKDIQSITEKSAEKAEESIKVTQQQDTNASKSLKEQTESAIRSLNAQDTVDSTMQKARCENINKAENKQDVNRIGSIDSGFSTTSVEKRPYNGICPTLNLQTSNKRTKEINPKDNDGSSSDCSISLLPYKISSPSEQPGMTFSQSKEQCKAFKQNVQPGMTSSQSMESGKTSSKSVQTGMSALQSGITSSLSVQPGITSTLSVQSGQTSIQIVKPGMVSSLSVQSGKASSQSVQPCMFFLQNVQTSTQGMQSGKTSSQCMELVSTSSQCMQPDKTSSKYVQNGNASSKSVLPSKASAQSVQERNNCKEFVRTKQPVEMVINTINGTSRNNADTCASGLEDLCYDSDEDDNDGCDMDSNCQQKDEMLIKCDLCQTCLPSSTALNKHMKNHSNTEIFEHYRNTYKLYVCVSCGRSKKTKTLLRSHLTKCYKAIASGFYKFDLSKYPEHASSFGPEFKCPHCKQLFAEENVRNSHRQICRKRPVLKCERCNFETQNDRKLAIHKLKRHGIRSSPCHLCKKYFGYQAALDKHMAQSHGADALVESDCNFICDKCGLVIANKQGFVTHYKARHGECRIECLYCEIEFSSTEQCYNHEGTHTKDFRYSCITCHLVFPGAFVFHKHMQELHKIHKQTAKEMNRFARSIRALLFTNICDLCRECFEDIGVFLKHMSKVHRMSEEKARGHRFDTLVKKKSEMYQRKVDNGNLVEIGIQVVEGIVEVVYSK